ncbi:MAG TPA: rod shape-determining protein MreC [Marmoricola sp.]|nr:rod shape-determining protein MreC [Marmoricola sp.]
MRIAVLSLLAAVVVLLLDSTGGAHSPLSPIRNALGTIASPFEKAANAVAKPLADLGGYFRSNSSLRTEVGTLRSENAQLRGQVALTQLEQSRVDELNKLTGVAASTGYSFLAAHVVAIGPAQSFARTVMLDVGTADGVHSDMTVVDSGGLVGRIVSTTSSTATVLLISDPTSVVASRLGTDRQLGTISGTGGTALTFQISGATASVAPGSTLTTWGSPSGIPYVAGIPIGTVSAVTSNPRDLSVQATVEPFAQFGSLDLVGVVVPANTKGSRPLINGLG